MITAELISYINNQKSKGKLKEDIVSDLLSVGWEKSDIEEGFQTIEGSDKYREPITDEDVLDPSKPITDLNFYPQRQSSLAATDGSSSQKTDPGFPTIDQEESLLFPKDEIIKAAEEPAPLEPEDKKEEITQETSPVLPSMDTEEVLQVSLAPEETQATTEEQVSSELVTEPVLQEKKEETISPLNQEMESSLIEAEKIETIPADQVQADQLSPLLAAETEGYKEPTVATGTIEQKLEEKTTPQSYDLGIPGVEFFDMEGNKIKAEEEPENLEKIQEEIQIEEEQEISQAPEEQVMPLILQEEISITEDNIETTEPSVFPGEPSLEDKKTEDEINLFRQMESELKTGQVHHHPEQPKEEARSGQTLEEIKESFIPKSPTKTEENKEDQPVSKVSRMSIPLVETPEIDTQPEGLLIDAIKKESQKIWTPMSIPVKIDQKGSVYPRQQEKTTQPETTPDKTGEPVKIQDLQAPKPVSPSQETAPISAKTEVDPESIYAGPGDPPSRAGFLNKQEMGSNFIPKKGVDSVATVKSPSPEEDLSKAAMLSSLHGDIAKISQEKEATKKQPKEPKTAKKKRKGLKVFLILFFLVLLVGGGFFAYTHDLINLDLSRLGISFVKKSPKELLLNYSNLLSSLNSYKTETDIEIISPSLSNISKGLISGEAIVSSDTDSLSINTIGSINKSNGNLSSDSFITIKGSIIDSQYTTVDIKDDGTNLYVTIPDLENIIKDFVIKPSVVKINKDELVSFYSLFTSEWENLAKRLNLYKLLSSSIPSFIDNKVLIAYNNLMSNIDVVEKGEENIRGVNTYRYSITTDRQRVKSLLMTIIEGIAEKLTDEEQEKIDGILGSLDIALFDVWIGKGDNNIYQYSIRVNVPLSKITGLEDKSIGDNTISLSWKTTYQDFNVFNNIQMPNKFTIFLDYLEEMKKERTKAGLRDFAELAIILTNEAGNSLRPNSSGNCVEPVPGSLFSPTGHQKISASTVGSISEILNKIMPETEEDGLCYSTAKDWLLALPLSYQERETKTQNEEEQAEIVETEEAEGETETEKEIEKIVTKYYCVDSTGNRLEIDEAPTGTVCPVP